MRLLDNIKMALFSIRTNLMRSLLTMLGIIIGVASVITIVTCGNGGRDYIVGMIDDMGGTKAINITVNSATASAGDYITPEDIASIKSIENVSYVTPVVMGMGGFTAADDVSGIMMTIGGTTDIEPILNQPCKYGRYFNDNEYSSAKAVAVMDSTTAMMLYGTDNVLGEKIAFTMNGTTTTFKIIGIMDIMSSFGGNSAESLEMFTSMMGNNAAAMAGGMIMIPASTAIALTGASERYETIYLMSEDSGKLDSVGEAAKARLQARHNNYDREVYSVVNMASMIDLLDTVITVFTLFIAAVSAISLLVGGIGVMNIMLVTVTERTREIGIRKALGARTKSILFQFLTESVIICLIGGILGLLLGIGLSTSVSLLMGISFKVSIPTVFLAIGFSSAIGIFFGIYPARKAAMMPPIEALRKD